MCRVIGDALCDVVFALVYCSWPSRNKKHDLPLEPLTPANGGNTKPSTGAPPSGINIVVVAVPPTGYSGILGRALKTL